MHVGFSFQCQTPLYFGTLVYFHGGGGGCFSVDKRFILKQPDLLHPPHLKLAHTLLNLGPPNVTGTFKFHFRHIQFYFIYLKYIYCTLWATLAKPLPHPAGSKKRSWAPFKKMNRLRQTENNHDPRRFSVIGMPFIFFWQWDFSVFASTTGRDNLFMMNSARSMTHLKIKGF